MTNTRHGAFQVSKLYINRDAEEERAFDWTACK
jgi:hypothetical protein